MAQSVAVAAGMVLLALAVVLASYLVVDPQLRWATPADVPAVHGLRGLALPWLPVHRVSFVILDYTFYYSNIITTD